MDLNQGEGSAARFAAYVAGLGSVIGPAVRMKPLRDYHRLELPGERKSVEPMAARTAPARTAAQHQSLLHFVGNATWSDADVLAKVREMVLRRREERADRGVDHRRHVVPEARQAFGRGPRSIAGELGSRPIARWRCRSRSRTMPPVFRCAYRLYPPETGRRIAHVGRRRHSKNIKFRTKPEIALEQIRWACEAGLPRGVGLMDTAYGNDSRGYAPA